MTLTHISKNEVSRVRPTRDVGNDWKPKGFWYEVGGDWRRWCASEEPDWLENRILHSVDVGSTNLLRLDTTDAVRAFNAEYGTDDEYRPDWRRLAGKYDGLEIAPYQWELRLSDLSWYYTWDCASGVIWRPRRVRVAVIGRVEVEDERKRKDGAA